MPGQKRTVVEERRTGRQEAKARLSEREQLRQELRARLSEREQRRVEPDPPPRYDAVFFAGGAWLDSL